jgi:hypothetical protein
MFTTAMLLLALLAGGDELRPLPAEADATYRCRARLQPEARRCTRACTDRHAAPGPRWDCVSGCTWHALDALAECRRAPAAASGGVPASPAPVTSLARR